MKLAIFIVIVFGATAIAIAQDRLTPETGVLAEDQEYHSKIRMVFADTYRRDAVLQVVFLPSFHPEEIAGIRKTGQGFEAFASKPSSSIWETYDGFKRQFSSRLRKITVHTDTRAISASLEERIRCVWQDILLDTRYPKDPIIGTDGEDFYFSMWVYGYGVVSGKVWSPRRGKTQRFMWLAEALADYARGNVEEKKLAEFVKPLEQ